MQRGTGRSQRLAGSAEAWLWAGWVPGGAGRGLVAEPSGLGFSTRETGDSTPGAHALGPFQASGVAATALTSCLAG